MKVHSSRRIFRILRRSVIVATACGGCLALILAVRPSHRPVAAASRIEAPPGWDPKTRTETLLGKLPLYFVENNGQEDSRVAFTLPGGNTTLYFTREGVTFALTKPGLTSSAKSFARIAASRPESAPRERWSIKLDFVNANPAAVPRGQDPTPASVNYFKGPKSHWRTGLKTYASVVYADLWPGVDMVYSGTSGRLKYTLHVKPGADPGRIRLAYRGATDVKLTEGGQLEVSTPAGGFSDDRPYAYQETGSGRREIPAAYTLAGDSGTYGFRVGAFDRSRTLVLDPAFLVYCGYIGGSGVEFGEAIAVDSAGNAYVTGITSSSVPSFPGAAGPDLTFNGDRDAFVAKVKADGSGLAYAGYIGGEQEDSGRGIAVDSAGNAYVVGFTTSDETSLPVTVGPSLTSGGNGNGDAFVAKVNPDGSGLVYCGYIAGSGFDFAIAVAVDHAGNAYVTGDTNSTETSFPVKAGPQLTYGGGAADAFVAKVKADGKGLVYAGYIGGKEIDQGTAIAVDSSGSAYVVGRADSDQLSFPLKTGPDLNYNGDVDAFVAKVKADGTGFVYSGYIGGASGEIAQGVAVDSAGSAYVVGVVTSDETTFPVKVGPDTTYTGVKDAFVAKVKPDGTGLVYCGYIGGPGIETGLGIAVDSAGSAYVVGNTTSTSGFPTRVGPDLSYNGGDADVYVAKVKADGSGLLWAGYLGGAGFESANGVAVDSAGNAYVIGDTESDQTSFPVTVGPDLVFNGGSEDAFVLKLSGEPNLREGALTIPSVAKRGASFTVTSLAINSEALGIAAASTTRYYLSLDDVKSGVDILLSGSKAVPILVPGGASTGSATVTVPNTTTLGSYFVLACADDPKTVAELDETDNCGASFSQIAVTLPDLQEASISQPPASANPGNQFSVQDTTRNFGLVSADASTTRYFLSTDRVKSSDDILLTGSRAVGVLNPTSQTGAASTGNAKVTIPSTAALGIYHLLACADNSNAVAETDERNNCLGSSGTVNLTSPAFDPTVELKSSGRVATVTVLATCTEGAEIHLTVSLTQGDAFGEGKKTGKCTGNPGRYPVTVSAEGPPFFTAGPAVAHAEAVVVLQGTVLDDHVWTRTVTLATIP